MWAWVDKLWRALWEAYDKLTKWAWDTLMSVLEWIVGWYTYIVGCLYNWFWEFFWWCEKNVLDFLEWGVAQLPSPEQVFGAHLAKVEILFDWISKANEFLPVTEILIVLAVFLPVLFIYIGIRLIVKFIPTIG